ncbi:MAG: hypothetical protein KA791_04695 [Flavobacteriales bacterium]|nr:hypothetical protein [Flavobacteriales bacterium]
MLFSFARPLTAVPALLSLPALALTIPQDIPLNEVEDPVIRSEVMELGGYQELVMEFTTPSLTEVPLFSNSPGHLEFRGDGLRVRIEAQPFDHPKWVKRSHGIWMLEDQTLLGWSPGESHSRLGRLEIVVDGYVVDLPTAAWSDVFDAPLRREDLPFASVMRSRDGVRTYVHLQAGDAEDASMVTWVFERDRYLYRVVDPLP